MDQQAHAKLIPERAAPYINLMEVDMDMNRLDETKLAFDEATKRNLDAVGLRADRYQLAFLEGDAQGMQEQVDASLGQAWI